MLLLISFQLAFPNDIICERDSRNEISVAWNVAGDLFSIIYILWENGKNDFSMF